MNRAQREGVRAGLRVGLTGGLASGKSTVGAWLTAAGFRVLDADRLVAELYAPGGAGAAAVRRLFGAEYLEAQGAVDHRRLAARVFADAEARKELERAIHPLVRDRFLELTAGDPGIVVLDATLLVEAGYAPDLDFIVTVEAPSGVRLQRAVARGMDEEAARARLLAQGEGAVRRDAAHRVLDNCCELPDLRRQVEELIDELQRLAKHPPAGM